VLEHSGFTNVRWGDQTDVFSGSKHESSAAQFDTRGVTVMAYKPDESNDRENADHIRKTLAES
jgi:hypothetical protein